MKPRQQRMLAVGLAAAGIALAATLSFKAFEENMNMFVDVTDVLAGDYPHDRVFRIGGLVVTDSIKREEGSMNVSFGVTDLRCELAVEYSGVLPDLFREGQGVVAFGVMADNDVFVAEKILAKHDENYMAPEVADSLAKADSLAEHVSEKTAKLAEGSAECDVA